VISANLLIFFYYALRGSGHFTYWLDPWILCFFGGTAYTCFAGHRYYCDLAQVDKGAIKPPGLLIHESKNPERVS
jgi:hypothetical protein